MKQLDEVIEILQEWMPDCPVKDDALHYLKKLQDFYKICNTGGVLEPEPRSAEIGSGVEIKWHEPNPALTWSELRQMQGKPVWIEESADNGLWWTYWVIWQDENSVLPEKTYGTTWRAYRKER